MTDNIKILMVDDRIENLMALEAILNSTSYELVQANSGHEALKQLLKDDFALILLDVQMPGLDGFETARLIRTREKSKYIPIIFITANYQAQDQINKGYELGAIDYILKPVNPANLRYKVASFVDSVKHQNALIEKEVLRWDQLRLIGEMAAGVSHEIRNPITGVKAYLQLLQGKLELIKFKEDIDIMIDELNRANSLISEFLSIGHNNTAEFKMQDLNSIINSLVPLIQADALQQGKTVKIESDVLPNFSLKSHEIRQMILNLCRNGLESMGPEGSLSIKTYVENDEVVLSIRDQGKGIKPEILTKLGTPFLSDKENGNGLGLSICYRIAAHHKAAIVIDTGSHGTTFNVRFKL
ncbi:histidine kinase,Response regulator receiver domain protein,histidine kinase [Desulfosporosinus acidiphilus SJ4]|uniref:Stage 0 sporulation protein A homolog n=1 Tax=Desulfosporosinus acidiphilus (strain DSM 22704 / JCM 16185 / SJ4) TaxID=646529 RepID=I4D714_DESAJ|nr:response regulator [Desulfosporosinus acidiphilus]AFM41588.1 histidine kinase,Response regulator receiver domain protein,histidine kinase [Desulfosporosinus acidiphilus SJ4]